MNQRRGVPFRHIAGVLAGIACVLLQISNHYAELRQQPAMDWGWAAPPPPPGAFVEAVLAIPGFWIVLPFGIADSFLQAGWLTGLGMAIGASFFWYSMGWYLDCNRGLTMSEEPPIYIRYNMNLMKVTSVILLPFGILVGFRLGVHFCANGSPPYWSEVAMYGIWMVWIVVGTFFAYADLRERFHLA